MRTHGVVKCVQWTGADGPSSVRVGSRDASFAPFKVDDEVEVVRVDPSRPDFEPGDRVRSPSYSWTWTVETHPVQTTDGTWMVLMSSAHFLGVTAEDCDRLTKLPREEAMTLRFVGSKVGLNNVLTEAEKEATRMKVRVERVEDPDAMGGEE